MPRALRLILPVALLAANARPSDDHRPPPPINNTVEYDHSYTPEALIEQFRDDDIRRNLISARKALRTHPGLTHDALQNALDHEDWQVRQVVCQMIWRRTKLGTSPVTERLIEVTIEGLRDDTTPYDHPRRRGLVYYNAALGVDTLIPIAHTWRDLLHTALDSDDAQQRFLAAYILARAGITDRIDRVSAVLIPHLRDNDIPDDAKSAVFALGGYGKELLPHLDRARDQADAQQLELIGLLVEHINNPDAPHSTTRRSSITQAVANPAAHNAGASWGWLSRLRD